MTLNPAADASWTTAFLARATLDSTHIAVVKTMMNGMNTDGLDAKCEFAHFFALPGSNGALNLKSSSFTLSVTAATHTDDLGYIGNGSSAVLDTGCNASSGLTIASINDFTMVYFQQNNTADNGPCMMVNAASNHTYLTSEDFGGNETFAPASGTPIGGAVANTFGMFAGVRSSSTAVTCYHDTTQIATSSANTADSVFDNANFTYLGGSSVGFSSATLGFGGLFRALSSTDISNLRGRIYTALHALNPTSYP
jgi:hypothetical protein